LTSVAGGDAIKIIPDCYLIGTGTIGRAAFA
jgi:hypothetical protein